MSDQSDDKPLPGRTSNGKSQFMNGGKLAVAPTGAFFVTPPAQFRMALVSLLAGAIGLVAGVIAYVLYNLIDGRIMACDAVCKFREWRKCGLSF